MSFKLLVDSSSDSVAFIFKPFGQPTQKGSVTESIRHKFEIYYCQETGLVLTFKTRAGGENHMDTGKHCLEVECESMYDRARRRWARGNGDRCSLRMCRLPHCMVKIVAEL